MDLTHASFFSGVGGLDLGLERAGWRTVSFSEIDPYASAVLAERWPGVPNLGDITALAANSDDGREWDRDRPDGTHAGSDGLIGGVPAVGIRLIPEQRGANGRHESDAARRAEERDGRDDWRNATLWSGGFPCQDLSVAGKRAGFGIAADSARADAELRQAAGQLGHEPRADAGHLRRGTAAGGTRSGLAFAFLDLVERYRPPAILLENVPGLLSSHQGRDFHALQRRMAQLGYVGAYRILDARHFGVPQRRRRVFIVALDSRRGLGPDSTAEILSVGSRCARHPATGGEAGPGAAEGVGDGTVGTFTPEAHPGSYNGQDAYTGHLISSPSDAGRVRAPDELARGLDDRGTVGPLLSGSGGNRTTDLNLPLAIVASGLRASDGHHGHGSVRGDGGDNLVPVYRKATKAHGPDDWERWEPADMSDTLDAEAMGAVQATAIMGQPSADSDLLPLGLDSHRYRCCGNGVVSGVAEWIGLRLAGLLTAIEAAA